MSDACAYNCKHTLMDFEFIAHNGDS